MSFKTYKLFLIFLINIFLISRQPHTKCSVIQEKLIKNLFKSYNKLIRPVRNSSDHVVITMDLVLTQLINVYEKEQIMKTNVWINLQWLDFQLNWTTNDYKVGSFRVPYDRVWTPDIVLFNNADGNYEASYKPNVVVYADVQDTPGSTNILWIPPAIYKSSCTIDVKYFPFDEQQCEMRFGSWTFDAEQVRLKQLKPMVNLEDYLPSGTWDVIEVPGKEVDFFEANRMELVYTFKIRRKTLFYTVNLIIPTVLISFLSIFVFYLPTDEGEKMTLCISILLALVVFLLLVSKILPPTSMVIPLISKYLIFTLMMNIVTILNTVLIINWNYRTPRTHNMPQWVRVLIIGQLAKLLFMERPKHNKKETDDISDKENGISHNNKNNKDKPNNRENSTRGGYSSERDCNVDYDCYGGGFSSRLLNKSKNNNIINTNTSSSFKNNKNYDQDSCSKISKDDISIPIIKSNSINFNNSNTNNSNVTHIRINNNNNIKDNCNSLTRPKQQQQQHRNLDSVAASLSTNNTSNNPKRSAINNSKYNYNSLNKSKNTRITLFNNDETNDDVFISTEKVNQPQSLPLNTVNSVISVNPSSAEINKGQLTTSIVNNSNNKNNNKSENSFYSANQSNTNLEGSSNLTRRANFKERRKNFAQSGGSQSRSLENALNSGTNSDNDDGQNDSYSSKQIEFSPEIMEAADKVTYITNHIKSENYYEEMREDWKYVALVIDRLLLIIFFSATVIGTALILFNAPHIFQFVDQQEILNKLIKANHF